MRVRSVGMGLWALLLLVGAAGASPSSAAGPADPVSLLDAGHAERPALATAVLPEPPTGRRERTEGPTHGPTGPEGPGTAPSSGRCAAPPAGARSEPAGARRSGARLLGLPHCPANAPPRS